MQILHQPGRYRQVYVVRFRSLDTVGSSGRNWLSRNMQIWHPTPGIRRSGRYRQVCGGISVAWHSFVPGWTQSTVAQYANEVSAAQSGVGSGGGRRSLYRGESSLLVVVRRCFDLGWWKWSFYTGGTVCGRSSEVIPCQFSHERPKRGDADVTGNKNKGITTTASLINSQEKDRKRKRKE